MPTANQFEVVLQPTECSGLSVFGSAALIRQDPEHHRSSGDECPKNRREVRLPLTFRFRDYELVHRGTALRRADTFVPWPMRGIPLRSKTARQPHGKLILHMTLRRLRQPTDGHAVCRAGQRRSNRLGRCLGRAIRPRGRELGHVARLVVHSRPRGDESYGR
jgi:hypothetical protein